MKGGGNFDLHTSSKRLSIDTEVIFRTQMQSSPASSQLSITVSFGGKNYSVKTHNVCSISLSFCFSLPALFRNLYTVWD